jgi:hypothetical protein
MPNTTRNAGRKMAAALFMAARKCQRLSKDAPSKFLRHIGVRKTNHALRAAAKFSPSL